MISSKFTTWTAEGSRRVNCAWRVISVALVVCALAASVATRYTDYAPSHVHAGASVSHADQGAKRQHIDKTCSDWLFSLSDSPELQPPPSPPHIVNFGPPLPKLLRGEDLYNRPPPVRS